jgi:molybdopterin/thiamine biosynthesis adenylyltransferase
MHATDENALALMGLLGSDREETLAKLATRVSISTSDEEPAQAFVAELVAVLGKSLNIVADAPCDVEIAIGSAHRTDAPLKVTVTLTRESLAVSGGGGSGGVATDVPGLFRRIAACFAAGNVIARTIDAEQFGHLPEPFKLSFSSFGLEACDLQRPIDLEDAVLVGAGGVGNGFMWAIEELDVRGRLTIVDPKNVSEGSLNRCLFFTQADVDGETPKAIAIAERTSRPSLTVDPYVGEFSALAKERKRVRRVFTTPDSRAVRRSVQDQLPLEVLDASTTDLSEVVVHSHRQPTEGACLACIYIHIPIEDQRSHHIAEGLGLSFAEVQQGFITDEVAAKLAVLHPNLKAADLEGKAFDTVYKEQCGGGALKNAAGQQAVAPLAFISNLAGALLALELVRFEKSTANPRSNYSAISPWHAPSIHTLRHPARKPGCSFCGADKNGPAVLKVVWSDILEDEPHQPLSDRSAA